MKLKTNKIPSNVRITVWVTLILLLGGVSFFIEISKHLESNRWLDAGEYNIVEGRVSNFNPLLSGGHGYEQFSVGGIKFEYTDGFNGGFHNTSSQGGPIKENLPVRVFYKAGRILKLEIKKNSEDF